MLVPDARMPDMPVVVRDATPSDVPGLLPLLAELGYPMSLGTATERLAALTAEDPSGQPPQTPVPIESRIRAAGCSWPWRRAGSSASRHCT